MIESVHQYTHTENFTMEKVIDDEHVNINHIVVQPGGAVPFDTKMAIRNEGADTLEFFVVKAPNPRDMPAVKKI